MFKQCKRFALANLAIVLTMIASSGVGPKSVFIMYEPDIPECLK